MKFRLTGQYGELSPVRGMVPHHGIDLGIPENTILRSIDDGVVSNVFDGSGLIGKGVAVRLPNGTNEIYGHMNQVSVKIGDHIKEGHVLGLSGNTGNSTSAHLHFGLQNPDGTFKNPTYLAEKVADHTGMDFNTGAISHFFPSGSSTGMIPQLLGWSGDAIKEHAREITIEVLSGVAEALRDILVSTTLVGAGVCVLLKVAGWKDGGRWSGILIMVNILVKLLLGGI